MAFNTKLSLFYAVLVFSECIAVEVEVKHTSSTSKNKHLPVVIWHGMNDSCCGNGSMGALKKLIEDNLPGTYVISLRIGKTINEDIRNSYFLEVNKQVSIVCSMLASNPNLKDGFNGIGFSQGGQFMRAVAQRCPTPPMFNLITMGAQHQGVYGLPHCFASDNTLCDYVRKLLNVGAYVDWIQRLIVQAQYWHDPLNEEKYRSKSSFIAEINNEKRFNKSYKENLLRLRNFVMIKFNNDSMVQPRESQWFGFYAPGQGTVVLPLQKLPVYYSPEDRLGLRRLDESGRLHFLQVNGDHGQFTVGWFIHNIINSFLK